MNDKRLDDLIRLYSILDTLEQKIGSAKTLADCSGRMDWPKSDVYFFRETGESRSETGKGPRIVRVGTHALKAGGSTSLWGRLSTHRGQMRSGGGNHRGSIFRLIVGTALIRRDGHKFPTWGEGSSAAKDTFSWVTPVCVSPRGTTTRGIGRGRNKLRRMSLALGRRTLWLCSKHRVRQRYTDEPAELASSERRRKVWRGRRDSNPRPLP